MLRTPYMLVVGDKEVEENTVSVRTCSGEDLGSFGLNSFAEKILNEVSNRSI